MIKEKFVQFLHEQFTWKETLEKVDKVNLRQKMEVMTSELDNVYYKLVILPIIPALIKFQRCWRRGKEKRNLYKLIRKLSKISKMVKRLDSLFFRAGFSKLRARVKKMDTCNYTICKKHQKNNKRYER